MKVENYVLRALKKKSLLSDPVNSLVELSQGNNQGCKDIYKNVWLNMIIFNTEKLKGGDF